MDYLTGIAVLLGQRLWIVHLWVHGCVNQIATSPGDLALIQGADSPAPVEATGPFCPGIEVIDSTLSIVEAEWGRNHDSMLFDVVDEDIITQDWRGLLGCEWSSC